MKTTYKTIPEECIKGFIYGLPVQPGPGGGIELATGGRTVRYFTEHADGKEESERLISEIGAVRQTVCEKDLSGPGLIYAATSGGRLFFSRIAPGVRGFFSDVFRLNMLLCFSPGQPSAGICLVDGDSVIFTDRGKVMRLRDGNESLLFEVPADTRLYGVSESVNESAYSSTPIRVT